MSFDPQRYWDRRYRRGDDSGLGSRGERAELKAAVINAVIEMFDIKSVVDWGCGDGEVLSKITADVAYTGVEISPFMLSRLRKTYSDRRFVDVKDIVDLYADLALSFDVIFHLPSDSDYHEHLAQVFASADRLVMIHGTSHDGGQTARHVRWRDWLPDVPPKWQLIEQTANADELGFWLLEKQ